MADIFREVDEDLRQESLRNLWNKYGKFLIAIALAIVLGTAAYVGWQERQKEQSIERSTRYGEAIAISSTDPQKAVEMLLALAGEDNDGYATLARFRAAGLLAKSDRQAALDQYDTLAKDPSLDQAYRSLADILWAMNQLNGGDAEAALKRVEPMTGAENPYHFSALEIMALSAMKLGDVSRAKTGFTLLTDEPNTPSAIRARAAEMLAFLKQE